MNINIKVDFIIFTPIATYYNNIYNILSSN